MSQLSTAEQQADGSADMALGTDRIAAARRQAAREDILYYWALAEAYLQDPAMLASMRCAF